jgi:arylsulfatase A-like enzyme
MARTMHGSVLWGLQGAMRDALPGVLLASLIHRFHPRGVLGASLSLLLGAWAVLLLFLCVSDLVYFVQCGMRLDCALVENMSWTSMKPAMTLSLILAVACGFGLLLLLGRGAWHLAQRGPGSRRHLWMHRTGVLLRALIIAGGSFHWAVKVAASPTAMTTVKADEMLGQSQGETVIGIARGLWHRGPGWAKPDAVSLSPQDRVWAGEHGLSLDGALAQDRMPAGHWHRVVVVAVESLAGAFLDPNNPRRPLGMTPFLDSLRAGNPHLEDCYSAGVDTEQGQFSLMCGRTDFEWGDHTYPGPTLFTLVRAAGYDTCMLFGDTLHFRDHDSAYPMALHVERVMGKETFQGRRPASDFCSWGGALCDHAVFQEAADYLQSHRSKPEFLLVDTLDTHPPYYWQKPEADFPKAVRDYPGSLPKALNQLDDNLRAFFADLCARGLFDQGTLVVITADHFPAYGEESLALSGAADHGTNRIPMIFVAGGGESLGRFDQKRMSSQLDLPPTLADLLGLPVPQQFMGRDLFDPGPGRALGRERDLVRFRDAKAPEEFLLCDDRGLPRSLDTPLARWYRWRLGNL